MVEFLLDMLISSILFSIFLWKCWATIQFWSLWLFLSLMDWMQNLCFFSSRFLN